jgi:phenylpyruvate tautomerase PptA (4-oxalocrotonate tautomerase family)
MAGHTLYADLLLPLLALAAAAEQEVAMPVAKAASTALGSPPSSSTVHVRYHNNAHAAVRVLP